MYLCSLSITNICPYQNPTATMGHSIHNVDTSKPLTHTTPYTLSVICPVQWKPGFIHEKNTSTKCQTPSNVSICPLNSVTMMNCSHPWWWQRACRWASLRWFLIVSSEMFWLCKPIVAAAARTGWLVSDDLRGEDAGCGGPGLVWLHVVCGCEAGWCTAKFSEKPLETAYSREMNIQFTGNSSGVHSCSQHANCTLPQICGIVLCDKTAHFRVAFYCGQPKAHLCNNHAV